MVNWERNLPSIACLRVSSLLVPNLQSRFAIASLIGDCLLLSDEGNLETVLRRRLNWLSIALS